MMNRVVTFALRQPLVVGMLTLLFVAGGIAAFRALPIEAFPDVTDVQVTVITLFPGHAPEEVEKQVTIPLEIALSGLPHSVRMFSHTQFGLSFLILTFDDAETDYFARQRVLERLQGVDLPPGVAPQLAPLSTPIGEIFRYRLTGDHESPMDLRTVQDWVVARYLKMTPGVADVVSLGGFVKQYQVNINLVRMKAYGVSMSQVLTALGRGSANAGGSYLEQGEQMVLIRGIGLLRSADEIGNIVVAVRGSAPLLIRHIAQVSVGSVPRQGIFGQDADDEAVSGVVLMRKGENPSEVLAALKERIGTLGRSMLPDGVRIVPYYDRTWLIHTTLKTVFTNLLEGALLVAAVLWLFLGRLRPAVVVAAVIPLALLSTFIGLRLRGIPANLLSLGALDFGIIVDGAVIVVENVFRRLSRREGVAPDSARAAVAEAAIQVGRPTFFSMLIIILAHLPIFTLQRHEGRIFAPMAWTVTSALAGSLLFSITLVPLLCYVMLRHARPERESRLVLACRRAYRPALAWAVRRWRPVLGAATATLLLSLALVPRLGTEFLPELNEGTLWVNLMLPPSISLSEAARVCASVRATLRRFPEVVSVISKSGRPEDGTDPKTINMAEFFVDLKPPAQWPSRTSKEDLIREMDQALQAIPGVEPSFSQPIRDNVLESISQIDGQVVIKIFGEDAGLLQAKADEALQAISRVRGVARSFIDRSGEVPQLRIEINRSQAARYGLNVADIQDIIETALGGKAATEIWEGEKRFSVAVRLREEERRDLDTIRNLPVDTPGGQRIPLQQVATISMGAGSLNISRESGMRVKAIGVFIRGRDMGSLVKEMQDRIRATVHLPPGYFVTWSGEFENQERAMARLKLILPVSVFLIFFLLFNAFGSVSDAVMILLNVPFALIGGILALLATGIHLSVSAAIGFIALFGQAVLNGVVMVSHFNERRDAGAGVIRAVLKGGVIRLRTVLMTALLAMLGLLPMAVSHGIGSEVQRPLAVVIIGGLVSATLLTLFVLPTVYLLLEMPGGPGRRLYRFFEGPGAR